MMGVDAGVLSPNLLGVFKGRPFSLGISTLRGKV